MYVTVDNHRLNDYEPYMWVSTDYGATFQSIVGNLRGEVVRTLTEDTRNAERALHRHGDGHLPLARQGRELAAAQGPNFPTVRVDEITHASARQRDDRRDARPRDLDSRSPRADPGVRRRAGARGDAQLFTSRPALQWKTKDDRNDEFWGHQFFAGENPPTDAVIQFNLKQPVPDLKVRIRDAGRPRGA